MRSSGLLRLERKVCALAGRCGSAYSSGARPMTERDRRPRRTPDSSPFIGRCTLESACGIVTVALCRPMRVPRALAPDSQEFGHAEGPAVTECQDRGLRPSLRPAEAPRRPVNRSALRVSSVFTSTIQNRSRVPKGVGRSTDLRRDRGSDAIPKAAVVCSKEHLTAVAEGDIAGAVVCNR